MAVHSVGAVKVDFIAKTAAYNQSTRKVVKGFDRIAMRGKRAGEIVSKGFRKARLAVLALAAGVGFTINKMSDFSDKIKAVAGNTGLAMGRIQDMRSEMQIAGFTIKEADKALNAFARRTGDAALGTGEAKKHFDALGISIKDASGNLRDMDEVLSETLERISALESPAARVSAHAGVFSDVGKRLSSVLTALGKNMDATEARLKKFRIEDSTIESYQESSRAFAEFGFALRKFTAEAFEPMVEETSEFLEVNGRLLLEWTDLATKAFEGLAWVLDKVNATISTFSKWMPGMDHVQSLEQMKEELAALESHEKRLMDQRERVIARMTLGAKGAVDLGTSFQLATNRSRQKELKRLIEEEEAGRNPKTTTGQYPSSDDSTTGTPAEYRPKDFEGKRLDARLALVREIPGHPMYPPDFVVAQKKIETAIIEAETRRIKARGQLVSKIDEYMKAPTEANEEIVKGIERSISAEDKRIRILEARLQNLRDGFGETAPDLNPWRSPARGFLRESAFDSSLGGMTMLDDLEQMRIDKQTDLNRLLEDQIHLATELVEIENAAKMATKDGLTPRYWIDQLEAKTAMFEAIGQNRALTLAEMESVQAKIDELYPKAVDAADRSLSAWQEFGRDAAGAVGNFTNSVLSDFDSVGDAAKSLLRTLLGAFQNRFITQPLMSGFESWMGIPGKASGGRAHGLTLVGEKGPELVDFTRPGMVYSNNQMRAMGGGSGVSITYNIESTDGPGVKAALVNATPAIVDAARAAAVQDATRPGLARRAITGR